MGELLFEGVLAIIDTGHVATLVRRENSDDPHIAKPISPRQPIRSESMPDQARWRFT